MEFDLFLDLSQPVLAEEQFASHEEAGGTEHPPRHRVLGVLDELLLEVSSVRGDLRAAKLVYPVNEGRVTVLERVLADLLRDQRFERSSAWKDLGFLERDVLRLKKRLRGLSTVL